MSKTKKGIPYIIGCFILAVVCIWFTRMTNVKSVDSNVDVEETISEGDRNTHFYYKNYGYSAAPVMSQVVPEGYSYIGDAVDVKGEYTGRDFEGDFNGKIYMSEDEVSAYIHWQDFNRDHRQEGYMLFERENKELVFRNGVWDYDYKLYLKDAIYREDTSAERLTELPDGFQYVGVLIYRGDDWTSWYVVDPEYWLKESETLIYDQKVYLSSDEETVYVYHEGVNKAYWKYCKENGA